MKHFLSKNLLQVARERQGSVDRNRGTRGSVELLSPIQKVAQQPNSTFYQMQRLLMNNGREQKGRDAVVQFLKKGLIVSSLLNKSGEAPETEGLPLPRKEPPRPASILAVRR